jgi:cysteinyl-tRNA synthetase
VTGESFYAIKPPQTRAEHDDTKKADGQITLGENVYFEFVDVFMADDFNTGGAVGTLFDLLSQLNKCADENRDFQSEEYRSSRNFENYQRGTLILKELGSILGLFREPLGAENTSNDQLLNGLMQLLLDLRAEARKAKNFALADQIRKRLGEIGVTLEDRQGGTGWRTG